MLHISFFFINKKSFLFHLPRNNTKSILTFKNQVHLIRYILFSTSKYYIESDSKIAKLFGKTKQRFSFIVNMRFTLFSIRKLDDLRNITRQIKQAVYIQNQITKMLYYN